MIGSVSVPIAVNCEHVPSAFNPPSKDIPLFSPIMISTPGSIVKSASMLRYPLGSVGLTFIGLSIKYHVVSSVMSAATVLPCPSNGRVLYQIPWHTAVPPQKSMFS